MLHHFILRLAVGRSLCEAREDHLLVRLLLLDHLLPLVVLRLPQVLMHAQLVTAISQESLTIHSRALQFVTRMKVLCGFRGRPL